MRWEADVTTHVPMKKAGWIIVNGDDQQMDCHVLFKEKQMAADHLKLPSPHDPRRLVYMEEAEEPKE